MKSTAVKVLSLLSALILLFSVVPLAASAQEAADRIENPESDPADASVTAKDESDLAAAGAEADLADTGLLNTPKITSCESHGNGTKIIWNAVAGAEKYRVYYKSSKGWTRLTDTTEHFCFDTDLKTSGAVRTYTVRCTNGTLTAFTSDYDRKGFTYTYNLKTPKIYLGESYSAHSRFSWEAVPEAEKYRVFYKTNNGWIKLADTADLCWRDHDLNISGASRTYTIRCISHDGSRYTSDFDRTGYNYTYNLNSPKITGCESLDAGVKVMWQYVYYAKKYRVYFKSSKGWTRIGDTDSNSIVHEPVSSGAVYQYTVRCISEDAARFTSDFDRNGYRYTYNMATPKISGFTSTANGIKIDISPVANCLKYRVFYKNNGKWVMLGDTQGNSIIHENAAFGKTYTYTVRCVKDDGSRYTSSFNSTGWNHTHYLKTPQITGFEDETQGTTIRWNEVNYADKYRVFYKNDNGWTKLGDTTNTCFTDPTAPIGKARIYTVRCLNYAANAYTSAFNAAGWSHVRYVDLPYLHRLSHLSNGIYLDWREVPGAEKYRLYIKQNNGWSLIGESTTNSFVYTGAKLNTSYTFTIRCVNAAGNAYTSDFYKDGWVFYNQANAHDVYPIIYGAAWHTDGYMTVDIHDTSPAVRYKVYVKVGNAWNVLKTIPIKGHISEEDFINAGADAPIEGSRYSLTVIGVDQTLNPVTEIFTSGYNVKVRLE